MEQATTTARIAAVLLAAGEGARMGGVPKCLLELDGEPLIKRHLRAMRDAGVSELVIVTGHYAERIEPLLAGSSARVVRNPRPEDGQPSSVRLGLASLVGPFDLVIVALADQPLIGSSALRELVAAFSGRPAGTDIVYPQVNGQRGNPVVFDGALVETLRSGGGGARKYIDAHPECVHLYESANEAFVLDLDTREDVEAFELRTGRRLSMPAPKAG